MAQAEGREWWAEVEHLREPLERRRAARPVDASRRTVRIRGQAIAGTSVRRLHPSAEPPPPHRVHPSDGAPPPRRVHPSDGAPPLRRLDPLPRQRPKRSASERLGSRPDRIAAWAVVFGLLMAVMAAATAKGATPAIGHSARAPTSALSAPAPSTSPSPALS